MKKRIYTMMVVFMLIPSLLACGKKDAADATKTDGSTETQTNVEQVQPSDGEIVIADEAVKEAIQMALEKSTDTFTQQELSSITEVFVACTEKTDLSEIKLLCKLSYLDLSGYKQDKWDVLKELPDLKYLYLQDMELESLEKLSELKNLRVLSLDNTKTTSLSGIETLGMLKELYITGSTIKDADAYKDVLNALTGCSMEIAEEEVTSSVVFVDARMEEEIRNAVLNFTQPITQEEMDLIEVMFLTDSEICALDDLVQCKNLKSLVLMNTQITNLLPMLQMEKLESVIIYTEEELDYSALMEKESIKNICINDEWLKGSK